MKKVILREPGGFTEENDAARPKTQRVGDLNFKS